MPRFHKAPYPTCAEPPPAAPMAARDAEPEAEIEFDNLSYVEEAQAAAAIAAGQKLAPPPTRAGGGLPGKRALGAGRRVIALDPSYPK